MKGRIEADAGRLRYVGFLTLLVICALFLAARLVYLYLSDSTRFPINTVKIAASYRHIGRKDIEKVLSKYWDSSFFTVPVANLYTDLAHLKWTNQVQIERIWPDTLKVTLVEKIPIATWNNGMLTEEGKFFEADGGLDATLPHLSGPVNQQTEVLQVYEKMSKILSIYGLHAASLDWRDNHAWEVTLANGIQLHLGKRDLETRITRFCKAYPAVFADKSDKLASVDLRYPRGMAVQWKK